MSPDEIYQHRRYAHRDWPENLKISEKIPEWDIALEIQDEWRAALLDYLDAELEAMERKHPGLIEVRKAIEAYLLSD